MREVLLDIIKHSGNLFQTVRVTGTSDTTKVQAAGDKVLLNSVLKNPIQEFEGAFGIGNLSLLKGLLNFSSYQTENSSFTIKRFERAGVETVEMFQFRDANDVGSDFRMMAPELTGTMLELNPKLPWDETFVLDRSRLSEFSSLQSLFKDVGSQFGFKVKKGNLLIYVGNEENKLLHSGEMVFHDDVKTDLKALQKGKTWSSAHFLEIVKLSDGAPITFQISSKINSIHLTMENEHATYSYLLR